MEHEIEVVAVRLETNFVEEDSDSLAPPPGDLRVGHDLPAGIQILPLHAPNVAVEVTAGLILDEPVVTTFASFPLSPPRWREP